MPANIHIIPASEFMVSTASGELQWAKTRALLKKTLEIAKLNQQSHILLDVRRGAGNLRAFEVFELVSVLEELDPPFSGRLAILNRPKDAFNRAEFFSRCARFRGFQVGAFQEFEKAIVWLYPPEQPMVTPADAEDETQG